MRARFLSRRENKQRKREREEKENNFAIISSPRSVSFSFIYTWKTEHHPADSRIVIKQEYKRYSSRFREKNTLPVFPLSERERSEKRTAGLINTRPAHVLSSTNRIESVDPPPFRLERLYPPRCCDSRSSWAVVPERTSPRRLGWSCYPCSRTDRALLWWWWSVLKQSFFFFFIFFKNKT